jgi:cyanophycinase
MRVPKIPLGVTALLLACFGCGQGGPPQGETADEAQAEAEGSGAGRLVIVGGALQTENTPVYQAVLDGVDGDGPICVFPTASGDPQESMDDYVSNFNALGGVGAAEGILLAVDNGHMADDPALAARVRACGGFFFTGGSQSRIMDVFKPQGGTTLAFDALRERFQAGAVVAGSSAGAAIMTDPMIAGGGSLDALDFGLRAGSDGEGVWLREGMGFMDTGLVDQHFLARGRWARLMVAVLNSETDSLGFGIDENTALVVEGDSVLVIGESGVVFLDARDAGPEFQGNGGYGIRLFLLGRGDVVDLASGQVTSEPSKLPLTTEDGALFQNPDVDLFSRWTLLHVLTELATTTDARVTFSQADHFIELRKEPGFRALSWEGMGIEDTPLGLSVGPFVLSVWRE